jgi:DNA-binding XRE family transcriptional regulator
MEMPCLFNAKVRHVKAITIPSQVGRIMSATAVVNGELIKQLRKGKLITQSELAKRAGIRAESLCRLEKGKPAKFSTIIKLAEILGVEPNQLIQG